MTRPSLRGCVDALLTTDSRWPWVRPTDEEADAAEAIRWVDETHQGTADDPDSRQRWGSCAACGEPWPCPTWLDAQHLAIQFLGRAAERYLARCKALHPVDETSCGRAEGHRGVHAVDDAAAEWTEGETA